MEIVLMWLVYKLKRKIAVNISRLFLHMLCTLAGRRRVHLMTFHFCYDIVYCIFAVVSLRIYGEQKGSQVSSDSNMRNFLAKNVGSK